jgi:hypothetical protein
MKWNYDGCKAFPFECPICGCGHSEPQKKCDGCNSTIIEDEKIKYIVRLEIEARDRQSLIKWLNHTNPDKDNGVFEVKRVIERVKR